MAFGGDRDGWVECERAGAGAGAHRKNVHGCRYVDKVGPIERKTLEFVYSPRRRTLSTILRTLISTACGSESLTPFSFSHQSQRSKTEVYRPTTLHLIHGLPQSNDDEAAATSLTPVPSLGLLIHIHPSSIKISTPAHPSIPRDPPSSPTSPPYILPKHLVHHLPSSPLIPSLKLLTKNTVPTTGVS